VRSESGSEPVHEQQAQRQQQDEGGHAPLVRLTPLQRELQLLVRLPHPAGGLLARTAAATERGRE